MGLGTLISIFGIGYNYVSGIHHKKDIRGVLDEVLKLQQHVEKLDDKIFYAPNVYEVTHPRQQVVSDLRDVRERLSELQRVTGDEIFSSSMVTTTEQIKTLLGKDPFDLLDFVRPYERAKNHPNPGMVPIVFSERNVPFVGWIMHGLLPTTFGIDYDENGIYKPVGNIITPPPIVSNVGNTSSSVSLRVKAIIVDKLGVDENEVTSEASFTNDLGADSLDLVELITHVTQGKR